MPPLVPWIFLIIVAAIAYDQSKKLESYKEPQQDQRSLPPERDFRQNQDSVYYTNAPTNKYDLGVAAIDRLGAPLVGLAGKVLNTASGAINKVVSIPGSVLTKVSDNNKPTNKPGNSAVKLDGDDFFLMDEDLKLEIYADEDDSLILIEE